MHFTIHGCSSTNKITKISNITDLVRIGRVIRDPVAKSGFMPTMESAWSRPQRAALRQGNSTYTGASSTMFHGSSAGQIRWSYVGWNVPTDTKTQLTFAKFRHPWYRREIQLSIKAQVCTVALSLVFFLRFRNVVVERYARNYSELHFLSS